MTLMQVSSHHPSTVRGAASSGSALGSQSTDSAYRQSPQKRADDDWLDSLSSQLDSLEEDQRDFPAVEAAGSGDASPAAAMGSLDDTANDLSVSDISDEEGMHDEDDIEASPAGYVSGFRSRPPPPAAPHARL